MLNNKKFNVLESDNLDKLMKLAGVLQKSTLHKGKLISVERTFALMLHGMEVGLSPTQSLKNIDVLMDLPTLNVDAQVAIARSSGELEYLEEYYLDKDGNKIEDWHQKKDKIHTAVCVLKRKGYKQKTTFYSYTDAELKGLKQKRNWKEDGPGMLAKRAKGQNVKNNFEDMLAGLQHSTEEMEDYVDSIEHLTGQEKFNKDSYTTKFPMISQEALLNTFNEMAENISSAEDYESCRAWYTKNKESLEKIDKKEFRDEIIKKLKDKKEEFNKKEEVIVVSVNDSELKEAI